MVENDGNSPEKLTVNSTLGFEKQRSTIGRISLSMGSDPIQRTPKILSVGTLYQRLVTHAKTTVFELPRYNYTLRLVSQAVTPHAQRRRAPKRKLVLRYGSYDEIVDNIIKLVITDIAEIETEDMETVEPVVLETTEIETIETESRIYISSITSYDEECHPQKRFRTFSSSSSTSSRSESVNSSRSSSSSDSRILFTADDLPEISPIDDVLPIGETPVGALAFSCIEGKTTAFSLVGATSFGCCVWYQLIDRVCVSAGWSAEADVNAGQNFCSSKRKRRRFVVANGSPAASDFRYCSLLLGERQYRTLISLLGSLATMRRVVNYHSSWVRQQQVELFDASGIWVLYHGEWLITTLLSLPLLSGVSCIASTFYSLLFIAVVLLLSVLGFDPMSLRGLVCFFVALFSENPGSTAGRGFNPVGGAPGGG
ncbi:hypothetical protein F511_28660 [Dorcoceras hygrometricum]|uniref:Uncharacterized protein n=1 Tax=Dorcoceras hygrometricum TaxID=472368 RepID=A0A2Z7C2U9_9LAMI|nr:hypothetical protein F511_28660 [Dorcoceras hygrometricum]